MFDSYIASRAPVHNTTNVRVDEHRAPTDESVKLLKDLEREAEKKIINAIRVQDNNFECVIHTQANYMSDTTEFLAIFKLNGKQMTASYIHKNYRGSLRDSVDEVAVGIRDAVAKQMANEIFGAFNMAMKQVFKFGG